MVPLRFSWDNRKNKTNQKKHGISFAEAQTVFFDENQSNIMILITQKMKKDSS
jgi:uncharacterized DUF497 family protein